MTDKSKCLVVLSGGQDSVTCLGLALKLFGHGNVFAISFKYGQRHAVELECAKLLCNKHTVPQTLVDMGTMLSSLVTSALVGDGEVGLPHQHKPGLPSSFVPGRNALFLTLAHAHAQEIGAGVIMTGVCQTDYSGYPDCRDEFVRKLNEALNVGYENNIEIRTPLMFLTKAETFEMAETTGFLPEVLINSHTCYNGDHTSPHTWGYGCGDCPACKLRAKGYDEFLVSKFNNAEDES